MQQSGNFISIKQALIVQIINTIYKTEPTECIQCNRMRIYTIISFQRKEPLLLLSVAMDFRK